jgi:hypothetical protein
MPGQSSHKADVAALATKLAAGVQKHFAPTMPIVITEGTFTPTQVAAQLQKLATLRSEVDAAKAVLKGALADEKKEEPALHAFYSAVIAFVRVAYEGSPEILADFGLAPKKVRKSLSGEKQAAAVAKRASTRAARGTMGPKKKAAIKGNVTGVIVTPITEPKAATQTNATQAPTQTGATSAPNAGNGATSVPSVTNGAVVNGTAAAH